MLSSLSLLLLCSSLVSQTLSKDEFTNFKRNFNKSYDREEEAYRKTVFESNMKIIDEHNKGYKEGRYSWFMGINQFTDMTRDEFSKRNNLRISNAPKTELVYEMKAKKVANAVDWRKKDIITGIKDQGNCGSCWAFGAVASIEAAHARKHRILMPLSEEQLVDCTEGTNCKDGGRPEYGWELVQNQGGIESYETYPYNAYVGHKYHCRFDESMIFAKVTNWTMVSDGSEKNLVRRLNDHPQTVAVDAHSWSHYAGGIFHNTPHTPCGSDDKDLNHSVFVVGYGSDGPKDYYIVKNSWGDIWGENGYIRIARGLDNTCGIANFQGHVEA